MSLKRKSCCWGYSQTLVITMTPSRSSGPWAPHRSPTGATSASSPTCCSWPRVERWLTWRRPLKSWWSCLRSRNRSHIVNVKMSAQAIVTYEEVSCKTSRTRTFRFRLLMLPATPLTFSHSTSWFPLVLFLLATQLQMQPALTGSRRAFTWRMTYQSINEENSSFSDIDLQYFCDFEKNAEVFFFSHLKGGKVIPGC